MLLLLSSTLFGFLSSQGSRNVVAQSVSGSTWNGIYSGEDREDVPNAGFLDSKDGGTFNFTIDSSGDVNGNGSGHIYFSEAVDAGCGTLNIKGDTKYNFSLFGNFPGFPGSPYFGNLTLHSAGVSPPDINTTAVCGGASSQSSIVNRAPLWGCELCGFPFPITMQLQNGNTTGKWHYYNSTNIGGVGGVTYTRSADITVQGTACPPTFKGAFEPVQAVWQDDPLFPDRPGKQLTKVDDSHYTAELGMVEGKQTLLFGTKGDRYVIHLDGEVKTTVNVAAAVRFVLEDSGGERTLYDYDVGNLPLEGPCGPGQQVNVKVPASNGVPSQPFSFGHSGPYLLTMELVTNGKVVQGSQVFVSGNVQSVRGLKVGFVPAFLRNIDPAEEASLVASGQELAQQSAAFIPDYFPLIPGSLETQTRPVALNLSNDIDLAMSICQQDNSTTCLHDELPRLITKDATLIGWITGLDKVFILLTDKDFIMGGADTGELGQAFTAKVIFLNEATTGVSRANAVVAHELVHTLPWPWSDSQMSSECGIAYHGPSQPNYGNGFQVTYGGTFTPTPEESVGGIMGAAIRAEWTEQCTYSHLLTALNTQPDPTVVGIRGWVSNSSAGEVSGGLDPGYTLEGVPDLNATANGSYALVFKNQGGEALTRYNFNLTFSTHAGYRMRIVEFGYRVAMPPGATELDLLGPRGTLVAKSIPTSSPTVTIVAPTEGSTLNPNALSCSWKGTGSLSYSVFVSSDNGKSWNTLLIDTNATSAPIDVKLLSPGSENVLEVVVTDGFHSQSSFVHFALPGGTANQTTTSGTNPSPAIQIPALAAVAIAAGVVAAVGLVFLRRHRRTIPTARVFRNPDA